ncbi:hypothetical protein FNF31_03737 [Cafeteria roenbergensis]|uniref:PDZ domain-containing protein n=1 Tax=Cafeteria roenbergensis TaxID=33653 RepID=A0A5A8E3G5_CAFRO|nr:hypothetical protein FNF31_03737 [Cafeteria roenbergensis]KAA0171524.1 hypothetical protein FNF28_00734 [Cafeteria roenbergensis]
MPVRVVELPPGSAGFEFGSLQADGSGVAIASIGPSARSLGLQVGDQVVGIDETTLLHATARAATALLSGRLSSARDGETVELLVWRPPRTDIPMDSLLMELHHRASDAARLLASQWAAAGRAEEALGKNKDVSEEMRATLAAIQSERDGCDKEAASVVADDPRLAMLRSVARQSGEAAASAEHRIAGLSERTSKLRRAVELTRHARLGSALQRAAVSGGADGPGASSAALEALAAAARPMRWAAAEQAAAGALRRTQERACRCVAREALAATRMRERAAGVTALVTQGRAAEAELAMAVSVRDAAANAADASAGRGSSVSGGESVTERSGSHGGRRPRRSSRSSRGQPGGSAAAAALSPGGSAAGSSLEDFGPGGTGASRPLVAATFREVERDIDSGARLLLRRHTSDLAVRGSVLSPSKPTAGGAGAGGAATPSADDGRGPLLTVDEGTPLGASAGRSGAATALLSVGTPLGAPVSVEEAEAGLRLATAEASRARRALREAEEGHLRDAAVLDAVAGEWRAVAELADEAMAAVPEPMRSTVQALGLGDGLAVAAVEAASGSGRAAEEPGDGAWRRAESAVLEASTAAMRGELEGAKRQATARALLTAASFARLLRGLTRRAAASAALRGELTGAWEAAGGLSLAELRAADAERERLLATYLRK